MRNLLQVFSVILIVHSGTGCSPLPSDAMRSAKASKLLFPDDRKTMQCTLQHVFDPYDGGKSWSVDQAIRPTTVFFRDGYFFQYDTYNFGEGKWYLHKEADKLALAFSRQNRQDILPHKQDTSFRYAIHQLSQDTMIVGLLGRHGWVKYTYLIDPENSN